MRSLYTRLLVAFLAVLVLATATLYQVYIAMWSPPVVRMISAAQAAQANEAALTMAQRGTAAAREYLARLDAATQMPHYLVDENGRDVLTGEERLEIMGSRDRGREVASVFPSGDQVVFVTPSQDRRSRLITLAPLPFDRRRFAPYVVLVMGAVAILFWLLVAYIVRPMRQLSDAVQRFGRGQFGVRADVKRRDEIGQLAAAFNDMAARIERLVTSERRLLQDVSHELRSPLTRLNIAIELLRTSADRNEAANRLQREAGRLSDLVATLLEVVRLEGDLTSTDLRPVRLADVVRDSLTDSFPEAEQRQVTLASSGEVVDLRHGNAELLRRALGNIIANAVRYAPAHTTVTIVGHATSQEQVIEVQDVGPGVDEDQIANLGNAFYRTDASRSSQTGGVGLGLAIARRAIQLHRGSIEFTNAHPGLRVIIRLPREAAPAAREHHVARAVSALEAPSSQFR